MENLFGKNQAKVLGGQREDILEHDILKENTFWKLIKKMNIQIEMWQDMNYEDLSMET